MDRRVSIEFRFQLLILSLLVLFNVSPFENTNHALTQQVRIQVERGITFLRHALPLVNATQPITQPVRAVEMIQNRPQEALCTVHSGCTDMAESVRVKGHETASDEATNSASALLQGELVVPEKTIAGGEHLILRQDLMPDDDKEQRFPSGYKYYYVDRFGLFDMTHIKHGKEQLEKVLRQIRTGKVILSFVTQSSPTTDHAIHLIALYQVEPGLSSAQLRYTALGIAMDFEKLIEEHQSPGSAFSVEDLPSDYVGYFIALNPKWQAQELLSLLDSDKIPTGLNATKAHLYKSFRRNREFRPIPQVGADHVDWPLLLRLKPAGRWSGYWSRVAVVATPDRRIWWQRWSDWGIEGLQVVF